jgi:hypothetical protein
VWARLPVQAPPAAGVEVERKALADKVAARQWAHASYEAYQAKYDLEQPSMTSEAWDRQLARSVVVTLYGPAADKPAVALLRSDIVQLLYAVTGGGDLADETDVAPCARLIGAVDADADGQLDILSATTFGTGCLDLASGAHIGP